MVSKVSVCPDPDCVGGVILVYNAYGADPLIPEEQPCDYCDKGFVISENVTEN